MLSDNLQRWDRVGGGIGWEVGGRLSREGTYVDLWLVHVDVWQKPTQCWKTIILQSKLNLKKVRKLVRGIPSVYILNQPGHFCVFVICKKSFNNRKLLHMKDKY